MTTFSKISVFVTVSLIILFEFVFAVFPPWLEVWNGPPEACKLFSFYEKHFKILFHLVAFQNKVSEIRVEYLGRQFLDPCSSSPPLKIVFEWGGGRIGATDYLSDVNTDLGGRDNQDL